jgi:hypothetical protein
MARFTESGAFAGASANAPRSRASFPGVVGPEGGNELATPACAAKTRIAAQKIGFRTGTLTRFSISVCHAGVFQKVTARYGFSSLQHTGAQPCRCNRREPQASNDINSSVAEAP